MAFFCFSASSAAFGAFIEWFGAFILEVGTSTELISASGATFGSHAFVWCE